MVKKAIDDNFAHMSPHQIDKVIRNYIILLKTTFDEYKFLSVIYSKNIKMLSWFSSVNYEDDTCVPGISNTRKS